MLRAFSSFTPIGRMRLVVAIAGLFAGALALTSEALAAPPTGTFGGGAYGVTANAQAGPVSAGLSRVAGQGCPCDGTNGQVSQRRVDSLSAGPGGSVLTAGSVSTSVFTDTTSSEAKVRNTARANALNLLSGLITASDVIAVAHTVADTTTITSDDHGTRFYGLLVNGNPIAPNVAPNTQIKLPGIGHVVLREEITGGNAKKNGRIEINMIHVVVDTANAFLPIGAEIVVAHAASGFARTATEPVRIGGNAWAAAANAAIGSVLRTEIGKSAVVSIGCGGTNGNTDTNSIASITVKPIITTGIGTTTAFGDATANPADAKTTASVASVKLLGLISAATVNAAAEETFSAGVRTRSTAGSGLTGAKVLGVPVAVHPNTDISLPGFGHVILDEEIIPPDSSNRSTEVNGIHVFINQTNPLGLPVGTEIIVAHAQASAGRV